jgi:hypothetical protein
MPLTVPEVRRLVLAMTESQEQRSFRFGWSVWRRAHQAVAARCHAARHARRRDRPPILPTPVPSAAQAELTDAEWVAVRSLLPPLRPPSGRPRYAHRPLLSGILWVLRTHASWRDMPEEFGKWETAYKRYRHWGDLGLWPRILAALDGASPPQPPEVPL